MDRRSSGNILGVAGTILSAAPWFVLVFMANLYPPSGLRRVWAGAVLVGGCAIGLAVVAGRRSSRWWYVLAAGACISELILTADFFVGD